MLIKKYKHKNISNNIQIKQPSTSGAATPATDGSCNNSTDLRHLLLQPDLSYYPHKYREQQQHHRPRTRTRNLHCRSMWCLSSASVVAVVLGVILLPLPPQCAAVGYSYTRFRGPVSGPEHRIYVRNGNGAAAQRGGAGTAADDHDEAARLDYVAKPEYEFAYGVEDAQAHILHNRNEMRDGDAVKGVYSVVDPDGTLRVVRYTADDINGFQAEVIKNGISAIHGQLQQETPTTISHQNSHDNNNNGGYNHFQQPTNIYSTDNNHHYHPSYYYPRPVHQENPPTTVQHQYNNNPSDNNNQNNNYDNRDNDKDNNDYDDNQDYNNEGDHPPQYEVHEGSNNDQNDPEDVEDQYEGKGDDKEVKGGKDKKKDYDDDEGDGDDDGDGEDDDYDDSEELEDYDDSVKGNEASDESDEYY